MKHYLCILLAISTLTAEAEVEERSCQKFKSDLSKLQENCREKFKKYVDEKYDLGIFGLGRLKDSKKKEDQATKSDLSAFIKSCKMKEASQLKDKKLIDQTCFDTIILRKTPFDN